VLRLLWLIALPLLSEAADSSLYSDSAPAFVGTLPAEVLAAEGPPPIEMVEWPITWNDERKQLTALYMQRHRGVQPTGDLDVDTAMVPRVVVVHSTGSNSPRSAWQTFQAPRQRRCRDRSEANAVNLSSHFVVGRDGTIYRLMPETRMGRHTIGLNHLAIGIENAGKPFSGQGHSPAQLRANAALVRWLKAEHPSITHLIGHDEYRWLEGHPYFEELNPDFRTRKGDPGRPFMAQLREELVDLDLEAPAQPPPKGGRKLSPGGISGGRGAPPPR
jgi:hypothetical protein